jgi:hemolysin III
MASRYGDAWHIVSCSVYGATMISLYLASTLYHGSRAERRRALFRIVDHACIYLLIAGTYTPFTLVTIRGGWGWTLFGLVWGLALVGIGCKVFWTGRYEVASTVVYVLMGWLALIAIDPILRQFPTGCLLWVVAGGVTYTVGVVFYALDSRPYLHSVWHLFVLGGSACHYVAVIRYVLPSGAWA